jgi:hypothetical protein
VSFHLGSPSNDFNPARIRRQNLVVLKFHIPAKYSPTPPPPTSGDSKNTMKLGSQWLMPVILATQEILV